MVEITEEEYKQFQSLKKVWQHIRAEHNGSYFICGEGGDKDQMGLPERISVCPSYGLDGIAVYTKTKDYSAPQW